MFGVMLIREPQTDLTPFGPIQIENARSQWVFELTRRLAILDQARAETPQDIDYGGAAGIAENFGPLEDAVDEARRMVCVLSREVRRRSEGEVLPWLVGASGSAGSASSGSVNEVGGMARNKTAV